MSMYKVARWIGIGIAAYGAPMMVIYWGQAASCVYFPDSFNNFLLGVSLTLLGLFVWLWGWALDDSKDEEGTPDTGVKLHPAGANAGD